MKNFILSSIAAFLFRLLRLTYRYELNFENDLEKETYLNYINSKKPNIEKNFLLAFFHQDEFALIPYFTHTGFSVLVSLSKDGELMTQAAEKLGYFPVRGSSSRGAVSGLIAAIKKVKEGYNLSFAVDGPRGPIFQVKEGLSAVARKTQRPILPVRAHLSNAYIFEKSWNKSKFPKPFCRITLNFAKLDYYAPSELEKTLKNL
jgi:lysophospholipid acyltransferase (LPLAT)-like uncharacterized protein